MILKNIATLNTKTPVANSIPLFNGQFPTDCNFGPNPSWTGNFHFFCRISVFLFLFFSFLSFFLFFFFFFRWWIKIFSCESGVVTLHFLGLFGLQIHCWLDSEWKTYHAEFCIHWPFIFFGFVMLYCGSEATFVSPSDPVSPTTVRFLGTEGSYSRHC